MLSVLPISAPILEKLFNIMDTNSIGMIDLQRFEAILRAEAPAQIPKPAKTIADSFEWQENIIKRIKEWVKKQKINALDAFRIFDQDFNGLISKEDMTISLIQHLQVPADELVDTRLDRLFRLLSFFKTDQIQESDFERLLNDVNPYLTAGTSKSSTIFKSSMGGGFSSTSTHDWKFAAI
jgi:Ca2+-binding EF-hand superfamily protein